MFGLSRLLELAGTISWRPRIRRACGKNWPVQRLCAESLEDRIVPTLLGQQLFPGDYPWNQNISNAPVATNSAAVITNIGGTIGLHPDWGEASASNGTDPLYGIPYNVVHGNAPGVTHVNFIIDDYPGESDLVSVPMPSSVVIEGDYQNGPNPFGPGYDNDNQRGDSHLIIYDVDNNIAYELFGAARPTDPVTMDGDPTNGQWHAAQESVWNMNTDSFRTLGDTSADAAGLSVLAGLARPDEGLPVADGGQGAIDHALRFTLPSSKISSQYIYPASHVVDASSGSSTLPFGARLRLMNTPAVNAIINTLGPEAQIIAHAMQQYGLVLADIGSSMYITGSSASVNANDVNSLTWDMDDVLGLSAIKASYFQVVDLTPQVTGLSVSSGTAGTTITVTGQNFSGAAGHLSVTFGNTAATSVTYVDDAHLTVVVPNGTGTVSVKVQSGVQATDPNNPSDNAANPVFGYGTSNALSFQFTNSTQTISGTNSTASFGVGTITSGNATTLTIIVRDTSNAVVAGLPSNAFSLSVAGGTSAGTFGSVNTTGTPGTYTVAFTGTTAGTATSLTAIVNGVTLTAHPTIIVTAGSVSPSKSSVSFATSTVASGGTDLVTIVVKDAANNAITGLASGVFSFSLAGGTSAGIFSAVTTTGTPGTYNATFTATTPGTACALTATVNTVSLNTKPTVTVNPPSATLPFTDAFSGPGSQLSSFWTTQAGSMMVANGVAAGQGALNLATLNGINRADTSLQADVAIGYGQYATLVSRVQGTGVQNLYFAAIISSGAGYVACIYLCQNGVFTALTGLTPISGNGHGTMLLKTVGTSIQLYWQPTGVNGFSQVAAAINGALTTGSVGVLASAGTTVDNFSAASLVANAPQNATLPFAENFSAANYPGNLGSQLSSYWTNQTGNLSIVNGNAVGQAALNLATLNGVNQANSSIQAVVAIGYGQYATLVSRVQGTGLQNLYFAAIISSGAGYVACIYLCQNGVFTALTGLTPISGNGQGTMLLKTVGTSIQLYWQPTGVNGFSQVAATTNGALTTGTVGILTSAGAAVSSFNAAVATTITPQNATLPFAENFAAANYPSNLGSQLSSYWTNQTGNLSIVNGNAVGQAALNLATLNGVNQANSSIQAAVTIGYGQYATLVSRVQGTGVQNLYFAAIISSGSGYVACIYLCQGGVFTALTGLTPISGNGQGTMLLKTVGTSIQLYWQPTGVNGFSQVANATNGALTTGTVGILTSTGAAVSSFNAAVATAITPQNATLPFAENFGAANYPAGVGSQLSGYWQNQIGDLSIVNGNATGQNALNVAALNGVNAANVAVQADVNVPVGQYFGLVSRYGGTGDQNMYFAAIVSTASGYVAAILVNQGGVWTQLTALIPISSGHGTLQFKTIGSSLQLFWNGTLIVSATDSRLTTGTIGVRMGAGASLANFSAS